MKKYSLFLALALLFALSCQRETDMPERKSAKGKVTYTLTGEISERTKAFIGDDGKFSWELNDAIAVLDATYGKLCTFTCASINDQGGGVFTFTGEEGKEYNFTKAWYPVSMVKLENGEPVITLPDSWTAEAVQEARSFPIAAAVNGDKLSFYHLGGLLKLTLNDVPKNATSLVLSSSKAGISGDFSIQSVGLNAGKINVTGENVTVEGSEIPVSKAIQEILPGENGSVTVTDFNLAAKGSITAYIPLPCGSYPYSVALKVGEEEIMKKTTTRPIEIGRANLVKMSALSPSWSATSLKAKYGSTTVDFVPSDLWGWYVASGLPKDTDIIIVDADDGNKEYGTRFATKKQVGYFCQCFTGGTSGAFPLKEDSDLYVSSDKERVFPLLAGASGDAVKLPEEYEVAHYGLRGDFGTGEYASKGIFTKTEDSPADGGNWKWYVVRNVLCTGTPIAFKLYGTVSGNSYIANDGVLETGTTTPQTAGVVRSLARPGGSTYAIQYNVTPGMCYDVYLKEDLTQVIVCEAGSNTTSVDENYLKGLTNYGLYNYNGASYVCAPGIDQTWTEGTGSFVFAKGFTFDQVQFSGLPTNPSIDNNYVDIGVNVTPSIGNSSSSTVSAKIVKIEGNKLWLLSVDGTGIIADYTR